MDSRGSCTRTLGAGGHFRLSAPVPSVIRFRAYLRGEERRSLGPTVYDRRRPRGGTRRGLGHAWYAARDDRRTEAGPDMGDRGGSARGATDPDATSEPLSRLRLLRRRDWKRKVGLGVGLGRRS